MFSEIRKEISQISIDIRAGLNLAEYITFTEEQILGFKLYEEQKAWIKFAFKRNCNLVTQTLRSWKNLGKSVLRRAIIDGNWQPNSAETIKRKGFNKPLIDTQQMIKSISAKGHIKNG